MDITPTRPQELVGTDFGPDPTTPGYLDGVPRMVDFADFNTGALLPPPSTTSVFSWGPTTVQVFTALQQVR